MKATKLFVILGFAGLTGCTALSNAIFGSPEQQAANALAQQQATNPISQFNGGYDDVFRSALRSLVDLGFTVRSSDSNSGFISASMENRVTQGNAYLSLWSIYSSDASVNTFSVGSKVEIAVLVDKINDQTTEVKVTPSKTEYFEELNGGLRSRALQWNERVTNAQIFNAIQAELDRRKGINTK